MTLTLDRVILHTIMYHLSLLTSTYTPNFIEIEETFCEWLDVWTFETGFIIRLTLSKSWRKNQYESTVLYEEIAMTQRHLSWRSKLQPVDMCTKPYHTDHCSVVKVVLKRRRGPPYPQSWVTPILWDLPLMVYFEHEKSASVASSVDWLLGITAALVDDIAT